MRHISLLLVAALSIGTSEAKPVVDTVRDRWTAKAIIEAPIVVQTEVAHDGESALYIVRRDDVASDSRGSVLFQVDLRTRRQHEVLRARWISDLQHVPDSHDWSVLADVGEGVQLYRLSAKEEKLTLLSRGVATVLIGANRMEAVDISNYEPEQEFGVLGYKWSPEGRSYWYSTARAVSDAPSTITVLDVPKIPYPRFRSNISELHVVDEQGRDTIVAASEGGDWLPIPAVVFASAAARWDRTATGWRLLYDAPVSGPDQKRLMQTRSYDLAKGVSAAVANDASQENVWSEVPPAVGPGGGALRIEEVGSVWRLTEALTNGATVQYGAVDFDFSARAPGRWYFPEFDSAVVGVRQTGGNPRNRLVKLTRDRKIHDLEPEVGLNACTMSPQTALGICIREGMNVPPSVVVVDARKWTQTRVATLDDRYASIPPFKVEPKLWRAGSLEANGFVVYPRNYDPAIRYPAILITHGYDADQSFAYFGFQWSYPVQLWSERGYVVICVNDIPLKGDAERTKAYEQWGSGAGDLPPERVQQIVWLDQLAIYKEAIRSLAAKGVIDDRHVGMAGYSRGSQMVNVAVSQTDLFAAASSGEGSYFAPNSYWTAEIGKIYGMLFGGDPLDPTKLSNWRRLSPPFRAALVNAPVLFQVANNLPGIADFHRALRAAHSPAEFVLFSRETHLFSIPRNRLAAMEQNLDWFDFWLKGQEYPDATKAAQYQRWREMKTERCARGDALPAYCSM